MLTQYARVQRYPFGGANYLTLDVFHYWERSPRVNGKLALRANPWSLSVLTSDCTNLHGGGPAPFVYPSEQIPTSDPRIARARAIAESDLRGALARKIKNREVGALGVSIATAGQSISMLRGSATRLIGILDAANRFYLSARSKKRRQKIRRLINRGAQPTAGLVLEGFFGWAPLIEDFSSAVKTLANPWPPGWVSSSQTFQTGGSGSFFDGSWTRESWQWSATGRVSYACRVEVSNPNLWLGNKLGLINLPGIAWDLVPWSFLVNMFSNMGQVMGSLTDLAGVSLSGTSLTNTLHLVQSDQKSYRDPRPNAYASGTGTYHRKVRGRQVGVSPPSVTPYMRFNGWDIGSAAILGSLLIQKVGVLSNSVTR